MFVLFAPLVAVIIFLILERFNEKFSLDKRDFFFLVINLIAITISLFISWVFLKPLVNFYSVFEWISLSSLSGPRWLSIGMSILVMDFAHYLIHRVYHKVPYLWKLHRLHHSDKKVDALTTLLHHPLEVASTLILIIAFYVVFDIPVVIIAWFSYVMAIHSAFTHTKLKVPKSINRYLQYLIVTPHMHRIHHSYNTKEGNMNFSNVFPWWDVLFKTYLYKDQKRLQRLRFGIKKNESPRNNSLKSLLVNPFI